MTAPTWHEQQIADQLHNALTNLGSYLTSRPDRQTTVIAAAAAQLAGVEMAVLETLLNAKQEGWGTL